MIYNWELAEWPHFKYDENIFADKLFQITTLFGKEAGVIASIKEHVNNESKIDLIISEAIKSSEIEGEHLNKKDVMSSIRNNLGLNKTTEQVKDKKAEGMAELLIDVRNTFEAPLTQKLLFSWHKMVMRGSRGINAGVWRFHNEPMQVISGTVGKEKIHFEAPPSYQVHEEMVRFIKWFNDTNPKKNQGIKTPLVRAAIAHLYFESIHPFEDGNGRIGRVIAEKALSQSLGRPIVISISYAIEANKKAYYQALSNAQKTLDITDWIDYFVDMILEAQVYALQRINFSLKKGNFLDAHKSDLNKRQLKVIKRMLDEGPEGFEGGMNAKKYMSITKTSKATATRDLQNLVEARVFVPTGGGRSTSYGIDIDT